jgi:hypothetical protein
VIESGESPVIPNTVGTGLQLLHTTLRRQQISHQSGGELVSSVGASGQFIDAALGDQQVSQLAGGREVASVSASS